MSRGFGPAATALLMAAVTGFRGASFNLGNFMDRYASEPGRSTAQHATGLGGYPKHPPSTNAQAKRAAIKAKNRAKHKRALRRSA